MERIRLLVPSDVTNANARPPAAQHVVLVVMRAPPLGEHPDYRQRHCHESNVPSTECAWLAVPGSPTASSTNTSLLVKHQESEHGPQLPNNANQGNAPCKYHRACLRASGAHPAPVPPPCRPAVTPRPVLQGFVKSGEALTHVIRSRIRDRPALFLLRSH